MPRILVSYRREDSAGYAGRLADRLSEHFGRDNVFVDIDTIRPGEDFVDRIDQSIAACDVVVAIIGRSWITATDSQGRRRLDREDDFVRMEIAKALERHIRVIPALVGDAAMPEAALLPQNLVALSRRQAFEISDSRFHQDVDRLIEALAEVGKPAPRLKQPRKFVPEPRADTPRRLWPVPLPWILGGTIAVATLAGAGYWLSLRDTAPDGSPGPTSAADEVSRTRQSKASGAARDSSGNGAPGPQVEPAAVTKAPEGKTGIQVVWRGATRVPCHLFDETGTKALSPQDYRAWECRPEMGLWDAAPGTYQIQFRGVATTMPPLPVTVRRGQVTRVEPPVGRLNLHWNGINRVNWYLLDHTGEKTLSPTGYQAWECQPAQVCTRDLGPGTYLVKVTAIGYQPVRVTVAPFRITEVTIP